MFGIKILKEFDYNKLMKYQKEFKTLENELKEEINQLTKDNASLREQLNAKMKEIRKLNLEATTSPFNGLHNIFVIKNKPYLCDKCKFDDKKCKKLEFANTSICVCEKEDAPSFQ